MPQISISVFKSSNTSYDTEANKLLQSQMLAMTTIPNIIILPLPCILLQALLLCQKVDGFQSLQLLKKKG